LNTENNALPEVETEDFSECLAAYADAFQGFSGPISPDALIEHIKGLMVRAQLIEREKWAAQAQKASARASELESALREIAKPIDGQPIGDPWGFYEDLRRYAANALGEEFIRHPDAQLQAV
jgi:hypothetical protein